MGAPYHAQERLSPGATSLIDVRRIRSHPLAKRGGIVVDGRMVERLHLGMAERSVQIVERIREMETACT